MKIFGRLWVQNWHFPYSLCHCFVFLSNSRVRIGNPLLFCKSIIITWYHPCANLRGSIIITWDHPCANLCGSIIITWDHPCANLCRSIIITWDHSFANLCGCNADLCTFIAIDVFVLLESTTFSFTLKLKIEFLEPFPGGRKVLKIGSSCSKRNRFRDLFI